jgi:hypothetical protein
LTEAQILAWADAHHQFTGQWPTATDGPVADVPGQTWQTVDMALRLGLHGLSGGESLSQLLRRERGLAERRG